MGTATQRYRYTRDFNWEVISFHCGGWCILTTQLSIEGSEAVIMAATNNTGQFFTYHSSLWWSCHEERGQADSPQQTYQNATGRLANCITGSFHIFTLYTMRSCSPSLRVVPSYLINFTKDRANIFSDLSLAEKGKKRILMDKCSTLLFAFKINCSSVLSHVPDFVQKCNFAFLCICKLIDLISFTCTCKLTGLFVGCNEKLIIVFYVYYWGCSGEWCCAGVHYIERLS